MGKLSVREFGIEGVCVDLNPLELRDSQLIQAQNCVSDQSVGQASIVKRPGLVAFNTLATGGSVLGGSDLPLQDLSASGTHYIYIGRGVAT